MPVNLQCGLCKKLPVFSGTILTKDELELMRPAAASKELWTFLLNVKTQMLLSGLGSLRS